MTPEGRDFSIEGAGMLRSAVAAVKWFAKGLLWAALAAGTLAAATIALALLALHDLEPPEPPRPAMALGDVAMPGGSARTVAADQSGAVSLADAGSRVASVGGHAAKFTQAAFVADGNAVLTVDERGGVRATRVAPLRVAGPFDMTHLAATVRARLWQPYGRPAAEAALYAAAQVLPLHIPDAIKGRSGRAFRDCKDGFCGPEMVELESGRFLMGSPWTETDRESDEGPRRLVTIERGFAMGRHEVTFEQWDACVADGGCKYPPEDEGWGRSKRPAINVSWDDIRNEYLPWLNRKLGLSGAAAYRLPTEAEWEYAARAGSSARWSFGDDEGRLGEHAWSLQTAEGKSHQVATKTPNAFGLHDMHGNVWEWCEDVWHQSYQGAPADSTAWHGNGNAGRRVVRGGSWNYNPQDLRAADRNGIPTDSRNLHLGFRVGRTLTHTP